MITTWSSKLLLVDLRQRDVGIQLLPETGGMRCSRSFQDRQQLVHEGVDGDGDQRGRQDQGILVRVEQIERQPGLPQDEREFADLAQADGDDQEGARRAGKQQAQQRSR